MTPTESYVRIPSLQRVDLELPAEVSRLGELAYNLWWAWSPAARQLFAAIDRSLWALYRNPVQLLLSVKRNHWEELIASDSFMASYSSVMRTFDRYMAREPETWFEREHPEHLERSSGPFAYLSMEFGVHESLAIYSGGLGVLSGDHCKSASDLGVPLIAVGLLYRYGYFRQTLDADGFQQHHYPKYDFGRLPLRPVLAPDGSELIVRVPFPEGEVAVRVWLAQVGRVPLLLLDTDVLENERADRAITRVLYVRGREMRLAQELVLGVGGCRALEALSIDPAGWHINEGHSALVQLERLATDDRSGEEFESRLESLARSTAFTTHTPVPAGNEQFDRPLAARYLSPWVEKLGISEERLLQLGSSSVGGEPVKSFNLTALGLRTSSFANGVSQLNAEVVDEMWRPLMAVAPGQDRSIEGITNGVHVPTWLGINLHGVLSEYIGPDWAQNEGSWAGVQEVPDREIWSAHLAQKERLVRFLRSRIHEQMARSGRSPSALRQVDGFMDAGALTIGFARRFATYKRAGLIFHDLHRLRTLLANSGRPVQIVLAGKAHPADRPGQDLIRHIFQLSQEPDLRGHVVFLEDYDIRVGRMLVQGVDVWLNNPLRPMEASGTSGQKAAMNGVLNLSIADGWWPEGFSGDNGWTIQELDRPAEARERDQADAQTLYQLLEEEVVPTFYDRDEDGLPRKWIAMMKRSIETVGPEFSSDRMLRDYVKRAYMPLVRPR